MKTKSYEKKEGLIFSLILFIVIEFIGFFLLLGEKEQVYQTISGVIVKKDFSMVLVNQEERNNLYHQTNLYVEDKKVPFQIEEDRGVLLKRNGEEYYEILLSMKTPNSFKANDSIMMSIPRKKESVVKTLRKMIGGEDYATN